MEIIVVILCMLTMVILKMVFNINIKKAKELEENKNLQKITDKFPKNIEIAKEMLEILNNKDVTIEEAKDTKTSLYIAVTNKISIADLKDNYGRIQTIAHECIHSVQDRTLLMFNFIFSNIVIFYYIVVLVLTILNIFTNVMLQAFILLLLYFIQFAVRTYLEIDAMTKSKYLAQEYMEKKSLCTKEEVDLLMTEYDKINKMGIPFMLYYLMSNGLVKIIVYIIITLILKLI